jgi:tetratricopeptide (TPR) repeat protein
VADCVWDWRLADLYVELGDDARAYPLYKKSFTERGYGCGGPEQLRLLGIALGDLDLRRGDPAGAVEAYAEVHDQAVRVRRGLALLTLDRPTEALADFEEARLDRFEGPELDLGTGLALAALGRREEAVKALETFLRRFPEHAGAPRARAALAKLR